MKGTIKEINSRYTCTKCGREWSGMVCDSEIPETCDCLEDMFRMPDGKWVKNAAKMSSAWARIYKPICKRFNLTVIGFDPNISFRRNDGINSFELPTDIAIEISKMIKAEK